MLTEAEVGDRYQGLMDQSISETEKALYLFLFITKYQIFCNGNKRTALLTANKIMLRKGIGLLSIPESVFEKFNKLLSRYYNSSQVIDELEMLSFMYEHCIFGINY